MKIGRPIAVADGVYQLRALGARVTVITDGNQAVLVDTGARGSLGPISGGLAALGVGLDRISLTVLTHYHPDHSGSVARIAEATGSRVAVHRDEARIVSGKEGAPNPYGNGLLAAAARLVVDRMYGGPTAVYLELEDGDRLPLDREVTVVHTPGHTSGSICLHLPASGVLVVGDSLQYKFGRLRPPARSVTQDRRMAEDSLRKLLDIDFDTMCFAHFPPLLGNARPALERLVGSLS